jgi:hypothetical protein
MALVGCVCEEQDCDYKCSDIREDGVGFEYESELPHVIRTGFFGCLWIPHMIKYQAVNNERDGTDEV